MRQIAGEAAKMVPAQKEEDEPSYKEVPQFILKSSGGDSSSSANEEAGYSSSSSADHDETRTIRSTPTSSDLGYESPSHDEESEDSYDWEDEFLPEFLQVLNKGLRWELKSVPQDEKPDWLNIVKFKTGQAFARKYYSGINFAEMSSLLILFAFNDGMRPLIFTEKSGTPYTAFRRYLSTALKVKSWFDSDIWDKRSAGYKNIRAVNAMHFSVSKRINALATEEVSERIGEITRSKQLCCPLSPAVRDDFQSAVCPFFSSGRRDKEHPLYFNQCSMSITQFGFVGLVITFPEKFGAANATEEELEGFLHVWRSIGYLLGVEDEFNFCNGSLQEVRNRCRQLIKYWVTPQFSRLSNEWEYYSRCMVKGISFYIKDLSFEVTLVYLCWVLGIDAPKLKASLTWKQYFRLQFFKFFLCFAVRIPFILSSFNWLVNKAMFRASNFSTEKLGQLEKEVLDICECHGQIAS